jgi:uncharacterized protein YqeY
MSLSERLTEDLKAAMRAKEKQKLTLIRSVKAEFKKREIDDGPLTGETEVQILLKMIKQRREAAAGFRKGGAEERALNEDREAEQLEGYLPPPPSEEEIEAAINEEVAKIPEEERSPRSIGVLMKALQAKFAGRPLDGKALAGKIKAKL